MTSQTIMGKWVTALEGRNTKYDKIKRDERTITVKEPSANHKNLRRTLFYLCILFNVILVVWLWRRVLIVERELLSREPLIKTVLETAVLARENRADINTILLHHIELLQEHEGLR